jgi:hypothetical protein
MVDGIRASRGEELEVRIMKGIIRPLYELPVEDGVSRLRIQSSDLLRLAFFYRQGRSNSLLVKRRDPGLHRKAHDTANWSYAIGDGEGSFRTK